MISTRYGQVERTRPTDVVLTPGEAAFVADVSRKVVDQAIDRKEIHPLRARRADDSPRRLGERAAVYLRLREEAGDMLSAKAKKHLYRALLGAEPEAIPDIVEIGPVSVRAGDAAKKVRGRIAQIQAVRQLVETDPDIRGGDPVVRGTRIPVYLIADMMGEGVPMEEIFEAYPAVTKASIEAAVLYVRLHPRRGRPRTAPWRKNAPTHVFTPEELNAAE